MTANEAKWLEEFDSMKGNAGRPLTTPHRLSDNVIVPDLRTFDPPIPPPTPTNGVTNNADIGPTLQNIATEQVKVPTVGGNCPYCHKPVSDNAKWCDHCGNFTKAGECVKCAATIQGPFCKACGAEAYKPKPIPLDSNATTSIATDVNGNQLSVPVAPVIPSYVWDATSLQWFGETMNLICTIGGCEGDKDGNVLDDAIKEKMVLASIPVANKHLQAQGQYKEEINLAMVCIPPVFMAFYFQYITKPKIARMEAKRKEEQEEKRRIEREDKARQRELDKRTGLIDEKPAKVAP